MSLLPDDLTPLNLRAWLTTHMGLCGCTDVAEMLPVLVDLLQWHAAQTRPRYDTLYPQPGMFYLLAGWLDHLGLAEHGTAIRQPWLTAEGRRLLAALEATTPDAIQYAEGEAYDGVYYPA